MNRLRGFEFVSQCVVVCNLSVSLFPSATIERWVVLEVKAKKVLQKQRMIQTRLPKRGLIVPPTIPRLKTSNKMAKLPKTNRPELKKKKVFIFLFFYFN